VHVLCYSVFGHHWHSPSFGSQDKEDDERIGLKSTALLFGDNTVPILSLFSSITLASLSIAGRAKLARFYFVPRSQCHDTGYNCSMAFPYFAAVGVGGAHLAWQVNTFAWSYSQFVFTPLPLPCSYGRPISTTLQTCQADSGPTTSSGQLCSSAAFSATMAQCKGRVAAWDHLRDQ
jgi:hypothetical protein